MRLGRKQTARVIAFGALAFWLPDTLLHAFRSDFVDALLPIVLTLLLPLTACAALFLLKDRWALPAGEVAGRFLLGIWLLGGIFMTIGASFSGGGFAGSDGVRGGLVVIGISLLPPVTWMLAAYDASLGALSIVTIVLLIVWVWGLARRKHRPAAVEQR